MENRFLEELHGLMDKYLDKICGTVEAFSDAISFLNDMRSGEARRALADSMRSEKEADELRRKIVDFLEESSIDPDLKEDYFHLIKRVDLIADWVKEAARSVSIIPYLEVPAGLREGYERLLDLVEEMTRKTCKAIRLLLESKYDEASRLVDEIERLEEEADQVNVSNREKLLEYSEQIKPYALAILLHEFNTALEEAADACEDAGDYIRALIVVYKKEGGKI